MDSLFDTSSYLYKLIERCVHDRCSPDALVRGDAVAVFPGSVSLPRDSDEVCGACAQRLKVVLKDLVDYGTRRDYIFPMDNPTPEEREAREWLTSCPLPDRSRHTRSDLVSRPWDPDNRRRTLGECVVALVSSMGRGGLEEWQVRWLCVDIGYSLDWLILGMGPMFVEWAGDAAAMHRIPPSGTYRDPETGVVHYEDVTSLRERQTLSLWSFTEWQWLHNLRAVVRSVYKPPTIPLLSRLAAGWRLPSQLPQMPDILVWADWVAVWLVREFIKGTPAPGWKQLIVEDMVACRNTILLLLGLGGQAGVQYRTAKAEPTACVLRLAWVLRMIIERRGRDGFLDYLDLVDEEARVRGFEGLDAVFRQRTWSSVERPFRKQSSAKNSNDNSEMSQRAMPWGIPAEARLGPLELLRLVASGGIACDPGEDIVWMPGNMPASQSPNAITPNPDMAGAPRVAVPDIVLDDDDDGDSLEVKHDE